MRRGNLLGRIHSQDFDRYFMSIRHYPLLGPEEEIDLNKKVRTGDSKAFEWMICCNLRLVVLIAVRTYIESFPLMDRIGHGNVALVKAVSGFRHEKGYRFSTYAGKAIYRQIVDMSPWETRCVYIPKKSTKALRRLRRAQNQATPKPANSQQTDKSKVGAYTLLRTVQVSDSELSLEELLDGNGNGNDDEGGETDLKFKDAITNKSFPKPDAWVIRSLSIGALDEIIDLVLSKREARIIRFLYGFVDGTRWSLKNTGKVMGVSHARVEQIEDSALRKIRSFLRLMDIDASLLWVS